MAKREVVTLNEALSKLQVPQTGDSYILPRDIEIDGTITVSSGGSPNLILDSTNDWQIQSDIVIGDVSANSYKLSNTVNYDPSIQSFFGSTVKAGLSALGWKVQIPDRPSFLAPSLGTFDETFTILSNGFQIQQDGVTTLEVSAFDLSASTEYPGYSRTLINSNRDNLVLSGEDSTNFTLYLGTSGQDSNAYVQNIEIKPTDGNAYPITTRDRDGSTLTIKGGDAYDSGATDRDGGDLTLRSGAPSNGGFAGHINLQPESSIIQDYSGEVRILHPLNGTVKMFFKPEWGAFYVGANKNGLRITEGTIGYGQEQFNGSTSDLLIKGMNAYQPGGDSDGGNIVIEGGQAAAGLGSRTGGNITLQGGAGANGGNGGNIDFSDGSKTLTSLAPDGTWTVYHDDVPPFFSNSYIQYDGFDFSVFSDADMSLIGATNTGNVTLQSGIQANAGLYIEQDGITQLILRAFDFTADWPLSQGAQLSAPKGNLTITGSTGTDISLFVGDDGSTAGDSYIAAYPATYRNETGSIYSRDGHNLHVSGGDAYDSAETNRAGGDLILEGGAGANNGASGDIRVIGGDGGLGSEGAHIVLDPGDSTDGVSHHGEIQIDGAFRPWNTSALVVHNRNVSTDLYVHGGYDLNVPSNHYGTSMSGDGTFGGFNLNVLNIAPTAPADGSATPINITSPNSATNSGGSVTITAGDGGGPGNDGGDIILQAGESQFLGSQGSIYLRPSLQAEGAGTIEAESRRLNLGETGTGRLALEAHQFGSFNIFASSPLADDPTNAFTISGQDYYAGASSNLDGGDLNLYAGDGEGVAGTGGDVNLRGGTGNTPGAIRFLDGKLESSVNSVWTVDAATASTNVSAMQMQFSGNNNGLGIGATLTGLEVNLDTSNTDYWANKVPLAVKADSTSVMEVHNFGVVVENLSAATLTQGIFATLAGYNVAEGIAHYGPYDHSLEASIQLNGQNINMFGADNGGSITLTTPSNGAVNVDGDLNVTGEIDGSLKKLSPTTFPYVHRVTVNPAGGADFTTLEQALDFYENEQFKSGTLVDIRLTSGNTYTWPAERVINVDGTNGARGLRINSGTQSTTFINVTFDSASEAIVVSNSYFELTGVTVNAQTSDTQWVLFIWALSQSVIQLGGTFNGLDYICQLDKDSHLVGNHEITVTTGSEGVSGWAVFSAYDRSTIHFGGTTIINAVDNTQSGAVFELSDYAELTTDSLITINDAPQGIIHFGGPIKVLMGGTLGNIAYSNTPITEPFPRNVIQGDGSVIYDSNRGGGNNFGGGEGALDALTTGRFNIALGVDAGGTLDVGEHNVILGDGALSNSTDSDNCVAIGTSALDLGGVECTAIGYESMLYGGGDYNVAVGVNTMGAWSSSNSFVGAENTAVGPWAMADCEDGTGAIAIGSYAAGGATNPINIVAIGYNAMSNAVNRSDDSIAIGSNALNKGGDHNIAIGDAALTNADGNFNIGLGESSNRNVDGDHNITIGNKAIYTTTLTGNECIAIGRNIEPINATDSHQLIIGDALVGHMSAITDVDYSSNQLTLQGPSAFASAVTNTSGGDLYIRGGDGTNLTAGVGGEVHIFGGKTGNANEYGTIYLNYAAVGNDKGSNNYIFRDQKLQNLTTGRNNLAFGTNTLNELTSAQYCITVGCDSLGSASANPMTGGSNISIGDYAMRKVESGEDNVNVGDSGGEKITTGSRNTLLGGFVGDALVTANDNVFVGHSAGPGDTGSGNVYIGASAGGGQDGDYSIIIGYYADAQSSVIGERSGQITIGNGNIGSYTMIGHIGAVTDVDYSAKSLTIRGTNARATATTNLNAGDLILEGGRAATTGAGVGGDVIIRGGLAGSTGSKGDVVIAEATTEKVGFHGATPVAQASALTSEDASTVDTTYGQEEADVINNLRTRVAELETMLQNLGLLA